ncbi:MAG: CapA family protein, partial [Armatimonadetes bacterium]|nr:CapA family protein [Armatimonadota bacterium]
MLDWTTGRYPAPHAGDGPRWRAVIAGDWGPLWKYTDLLCDEPVGIYGDLLPTLRDNDLRIVNVECVLGDEGQPIPKAGPNLNGSPRAIEALTSVPWDVATLCNNHVLDFGPAGLEATLARL